MADTGFRKEFMSDFATGVEKGVWAGSPQQGLRLEPPAAEQIVHL